MTFRPLVLSRPAIAVIEEGRQKRWGPGACQPVTDLSGGAVSVDGWPAFAIRVRDDLAVQWEQTARERGVSVSRLIIDSYLHDGHGGGSDLVAVPARR